MKVKRLWVTENPTQAIEYAARLCYDSHDKMKEGSAEKLVRACMNKGHYSITEHASASFHVSGVSRAFLAQISRHRHLSFCVRSQRYCKEGGFNYVEPSMDVHQHGIFTNAMLSVEHAYNLLLKSGMKAEDARGVLPNACHTEMVVTANFRAWYEFLSKRTDRAAQSEIRDVALLIQSDLQTVCPAIFGVNDES